ncbi:MAG TPA: S8 family peptidase [Gemmatimonadaceae bacterium]|nr:S8 family peptidase [Gemmatimonadaceae bacterium]
MKGHLAVALSAVLIAACADPTSIPTPAAPLDPTAEAPVMARGGAGGPIPGQYIVVFKDDVTDAPGLSQRMSNEHAAQRMYTYTGVLKGFAARMSPQAAEALTRNPNVAYVEQDQEVSLAATQTGATWGIDRIDQRNRPLSGTYTYTTTASNVYVYIIDTGILTSHSQFGGRAANVYDAFGGNGTDCNGHGTHVAGTVGGSTYGIAKGARLRGVRVLNCSGSGSWSGIIAGMDWVRNNRTNPAVANMSLGGGYSSAVNTAANNLANSGVFVAVASGNSNRNACNYSPASASAVTSVNSSTSTDGKSSFSNYGSCTHLYAPGSSVTSAWIGSTSATRTISGTSMASPHVAGVAALYKATFGNASSSTIRSWLINNATTSVISGNPSGTPNRLLYKSTL